MVEHFNNSFYLEVSDANSDDKNSEQQHSRQASALIDATSAEAAAAASTSSLSSDPVNESNAAAKSAKKDVIIVDCYDTAETIPYKPLDYHWFYTDKSQWLPLSNKDSKNLDQIYTANLKTIKVVRAASPAERQELLKGQEHKFLVSVNGGRYECDLVDLVKRPIYWTEKKLEKIRRCLWFYKENHDQIYVPYEEEYSEFLEKEYEKAIRTNIFHKRIDFRPTGTASSFSAAEASTEPSTPTCEEAFVFHSTSLMQHFQNASMLDEFGNVSSDAKRPLIVKRGIQEVVEKVKPDEIDEIDELCFVVHGIGEGCDIKFRPIVECVDDFRDMSSYIIQAHFKSNIDSKRIKGRVEFLPIYWHGELHGNNTGVDDRLKPITLPSIPKLRQYSNSTILDVLFYTSPIYCQTIISKVGSEINRLYSMFKERNPSFNGNVSLVGHSLGSLIVFDLLSHQHDNEEADVSDQLKSNVKKIEENYASLEQFLDKLKLAEFKAIFEKEKITLESLTLLTENDFIKLGIPLGPRRILVEALNSDAFKREREEVEKRINANLQTFKMQEIGKLNPAVAATKGRTESVDYCKYGLAGTGQLLIKYPQLSFKVKNFFALGSPLAMFLTVRGVESLGPDFKLPTCDSFFNIFHPFDPVAYRFEPLVAAESSQLAPVLLPHHKGRKRLHIELREGFTKVSVDIKQRMYGQITKAWSSLAEFAKMPAITASQTAASAAASEESTPLAEAAKKEASAVEAAVGHVETKEPFHSTLHSIESQLDMTEEVVKVDEEAATAKIHESTVNWGKINKGRRIDYVLQESPFESFNEYLFALASHACYWESEDTILLMMKEVYGEKNPVDSNVDTKAGGSGGADEQTPSSWLDANVKKTFSYFNLAIPQSLTSVLGSSTASSILPTTSSCNLTGSKQ